MAGQGGTFDGGTGADLAFVLLRTLFGQSRLHYKARITTLFKSCLDRM